MLQAANISVSARFMEAEFFLAPEDPRSDTVRAVQGSHIVATNIVVQTDSFVLKVAYDPRDEKFNRARVQVSTADHNVMLTDVFLTYQDELVDIGLATVQMKKANPFELVVTTPDWRISAQPGTYRTTANKLEKRVDLGVVAVTDPLLAPVAPHGLLGQGELLISPKIRFGGGTSDSGVHALYAGASLLGNSRC